MDIGSIFLGLLGLYTGAKTLKQGFGDVESSPGPRRRGQMQLHHVRTLDDRIRYIRAKIREGRLDKRVRQFTVRIVSQKCGSDWCVPEKDWAGEAKAVFMAIRRNVRYVRDTFGVDLYQNPWKTLQLGGGDCDDEGAIVLGSMLQSIGFTVKLRVIRTRDSADWNHIYLLAWIPGRAGRGHWLPLDPTVPKPPGWEAPASIVAAVRDFPVS